jgi:hypothetical protein
MPGSSAATSRGGTNPVDWRRKPIFLVAGIGLLLLGVVVATRKPPPPPRTLVEQQAVSLVGAFNQADNRGLLNTVSPDFAAGGWTKPRLQLALMRWKRQGIQATLQPLSVTASGTNEYTVTANLQARDTRTQEGVWSAPETSMVFRLERPTPDIPFLPGTWRVVSISGASLPDASVSE